LHVVKQVLPCVLLLMSLLLLLLLQGDGRDLIIVDTSGRHKQEAALFEEMRQVGGGDCVLTLRTSLGCICWGQQYQRQSQASPYMSHRGGGVTHS
jgi:hypothetical protein